MRSFLMPACALIFLYGCSAEPPAARPDASGPDFRIVADVKQTMQWILEPQADVLWDAVGTIIEDDVTEIVPKTDEQWTAVRNSAASVAEAGNLLLMPGRARDQDDWAKHVHTMVEAAKQALQAAEAKDPELLFTAGGDIYLACSACHAQYALELQKVN